MRLLVRNNEQLFGITKSIMIARTVAVMIFNTPRVFAVVVEQKN